MPTVIWPAARFCAPSSELHIAEDWFRRTALGDLLGISDDKVNDDRLYRALDRLLPQKILLEFHLKQRLGELFGLEYDLLLYDITSTYFEPGNFDRRHPHGRTPIRIESSREDCRDPGLVSRCRALRRRSGLASADIPERHRSGGNGVGVHGRDVGGVKTSDAH